MATGGWHADEPTDVVKEPRETASTTTLIIGYVHSHGGDAAVADLLRRAAVPFTAEQLQDPARVVLLRDPYAAVRGGSAGYR